MAFSKDGKTLVSASHDGTLKLWPVEKVAEPETLDLKLGEIYTLAASADGRFLAAGGTNGVVKLWTWGQWNTPVELKALPGKIHALAFSPNGELLGSGEGQGTDSRVRLYQTSDGKLTLSWEAGKSPINGLAFHPGGKWLATTGGSNFVRLWEVDTGKLVSEFGEWTTLGFPAFHPDGKGLYAFLPYNRGLLFDLPDLKRSVMKGRDIYLEPQVASVAYSPDGKFLSFGTPTGEVVIWENVKWEKILPKEGHSHFVTALAVGPDGRTVLSGGDENVLRRWDVGRPGESQLLHRFDRFLLDVAWSPDAKRFATLATFEWFDNEQRGVVWDASTGKQLLKLDPLLNIYRAAFSPDSKLIAGCSYKDECLHLWDANTGKKVHQFPKVGICLDRPAFSADGKLVAVVTRETKTVKIWNVASGEEVQFWEDQPMRSVALSRDGRLVAASHFDGTISLWDLSGKDRKKRALAGHSAQVNTMRFTPDGKTLISSSDDGTIRLWNIGVEQALKEIISVGPAKKPLRFDLDPSGQYLFAFGNSPLIYVLRLPPGEDKPPVLPGDASDRKAAEWVLSLAGPHRGIRVKENGNERHTSEQPAGPFELTGVILQHNQKVTDADLANLKDCKNLTLLQLTYTNIGDDGVANFKNHKKLTELDLPGRVTDAGLANFNDCKDLTTLTLHGLRVSDTGLANFKDCNGLTTLSLRSSSLNAVTLAHFKDCKDLTFLDVADSGVKPAELVHFKDCKKLKHLDLDGSLAGDVELAYFKDCKDLTFLNLKNTKVSDQGLAPIMELKNLTSLTLFKTLVTQAGIDALKKALPKCLIAWDGGVIDPNKASADPNRRAAEWATKVGGTVSVSLDGKILTVNPEGKFSAENFVVERIDLPHGTRIADVDLAFLNGLTGLRTLILSGTPVGDGAAEHLVKIVGLTDLHLADTKMGDDGVVRLKELKGLRLLTLAGTSVGDGSVVSLGGLPNLEDLNLHNTAVGDLSVAAIAKCPKLQVLHLTRTIVSDRGLTHLAEVKTLRQLTLSGKKVTEAGVNKLRTALPDCKIDWDSSTMSP